MAAVAGGGLLGGCGSAPAPGAPAANRPLTAAEPATAPAAPSPDSAAADALARRVEQFARSLDAPPPTPGQTESTAMSPASSPQTAPPAADGEPAAVVRVPRDRPAVSAVEALPDAAAALPPSPAAAGTAEPSWDDPPAAPADPAAADAASLREAVARRAREHPASAADALDYELVRLLDAAAEPVPAGYASADTADAAAPVTTGDLSGEDRRILGTVRAGLQRFRGVLRRADAEGPAPLPSEKIEPLVQMSRALRRDVGLTLPTVALCSEVRLFGSYEPLPTTFAAGKSHLAILYVEVDGFASQEATGGEWETKMALSATLYDADGKPVLTLPEAQAVDRSRGRRRDFYLCSYLTLPADTRPGPQTLKVTVRDEFSRKIAQQSLKLAFVAK